MPKTKQPRILLIDSSALIHRAFHAFPKELTTKDGQMINAVYGFGAMLLQVLKTFKPEYVFFAFDSPGENFRDKMFKEYKANRPDTDQGLVSQFPMITELMTKFKAPVLEKSGFEADDIIGTLVHNKSLSEFEKIIVTGDRDILQLINQNTKVFLAGGSFSKSLLYDDEAVKQKYGFGPQQLIEYKAIFGDPSDNIPGAKGIGEKGAAELIIKYGTLEEIYKHLDDLKAGLKTKLEASKETVFLSRELSTIVDNADVKIDLAEGKTTTFDFAGLEKEFIKYQFTSLLPRLQSLTRDYQLPIGPEGKQAAPQAKREFKFDFRKHEIANVTKLQEFVARFKKEKWLALRSDGSSLYVAHQDNVGKFSFKFLQENKNWQDLQKSFIGLKVVAHDSKKLIHQLNAANLSLNKTPDDLMLIAYLTEGGIGKYNLETLSVEYLQQSLPIAEQQNLFDDGSIQIETYHVYLLSGILLEKIEAANEKNNIGWSLEKLYRDVELPIVEVLVAIEDNGVVLDKEYLAGFAKELTDLLSSQQKEIFKMAGEEFNISSPKQLSEVLFGKMGIPGGKKNKSGGFSTNEKILLNYLDDYPIIEKILSYREIFKLKSTYTQTLIDEVNPKTNRIHTDFKQAVAATGRLSSTNPNLQNIPVSSDFGQQIRKAFVAPKDKLLLSFDYSQQELRLLAHLSGEKKLTEAFTKNIDIHALTASQIFKVSIRDVTSQQRRVGKTVNFGVVYGISAFGLSDRLKISNQDSQKFIDSFYNSYPKVRQYFDDLKQKARVNGYVETIFGRRRDASLLTAANYQVRTGTEREIINFPLQGGAADIMKLAMIRAQKLIATNYAEFAMMVLQVHDELIFEINTIDLKNKKFEKLIAEIKEIMLNVTKLDVPVNVGVEAGKNWAEMKELA